MNFTFKMMSFVFKMMDLYFKMMDFAFKMMQRWNLTSISEEYRRYAGAKVRLLSVFKI